MKRKQPTSKALSIAPSQRGDVSMAQIAAIRRALLREGALQLVESWRGRHDRTRPRAGRPEKQPLAALLIVLIAVAERGQAPLLKNVASAIRYDLSYAAAMDLGIPADTYLLRDHPDGLTWWDVKGTDEEDMVEFVLKPETIYDRTQAAFDRLTSLIEPYPGVATRHARPYREVKESLDQLKAKDIETKLERLQRLTNAIVRASLHRLPRRERRQLMKHWEGSVAIDGTKMPVNCPEGRGGVPVDMRKLHPEWIHHREAAAGYHVRKGNHAGLQDDGETPVSDKDKADSTWAYELHLAVACAGGIKQGPVPRVALGMAFDTPAGRIGENSLVTLRSANQVSQSLGIKPGVVVADRAILPNSKPKKFQQPARDLGYELVMDYRKDQLGAIDPLKGKNADRPKTRKPLAQQQGEPDPLKGALLVEGDFYCPGMPKPFIEAQALFRRPKKDPDRIDQATRDSRIDLRPDYLLTRKEKLNSDGRIRLACPATAPGGKVKCPLRPDYVFANDADRTEVENPPTHLPEICGTQHRSVALQLDDRTAKYVQDKRYRSREWYRHWGERNRAESFNASLKQKDHENLNDGARRPVVGFAKQALLAAVLVFTANLRTLRKFMQKHGKQIPAAPPEPDPSPPGPNTERNVTFIEERPPPDRIAA